MLEIVIEAPVLRWNWRSMKERWGSSTRTTNFRWLPHDKVDVGKAAQLFAADSIVMSNSGDAESTVWLITIGPPIQRSCRRNP